jgi:3-oxoacyl-[acyl-carrier protein] reductase
MGTPRLSAYCASKWGLVGLVKSLAEELRGTGLQSMCVMPGSVDTDMLRGSGFSPAMTPEDVARIVAWVALDAPDAMNGSCVDAFGP